MNMPQDMINKIMTRNMVNLTRGQAPCAVDTLINTKSYLWVSYLWVIFCIFAVENQ